MPIHSLVGKPWLQGFDSVGVNSTLSFSSTSGSLSSFASNTNATSKVESDVGLFQGSKEGHLPYKTHEANVSGDTKVGDLKEARMGSGKTHFGNLTESLKNGSFPDKEKVGDSLASDGGLILRKNNSGNFSKTVKDESLRGKEGIVIENLSLSSVKDMNSVAGKSARNSSNRNNGTENKNVGNFSYNAGLDKAATSKEIAYKAKSSFKGRNGSFETLRLDLMDQTTSMYHDADVLVFNTGHWWTHEKTSRGEDYYQEGNYVHPRLKALEAYKRALTTWARWVDKNIDFNRTQVFFRGYSVTHFRGGQWNSGGQCHKETEPIFNETYLAKYPSKMRTLEHVLQSMRSPVVYMNISRLTDYRKDGHPSAIDPDGQMGCLEF
ncbi:protein trichome birefringence-like 2 [Quercus suber]|uniref:Protein trichome birefringence-like 2 n=1 Tax=Quercus suber TaxID=58331 RepID=A0AAW0KT52_QUESU